MDIETLDREDPGLDSVIVKDELAPFFVLENTENEPEGTEGSHDALSNEETASEQQSEGVNKLSWKH